MFTDRVLFNPHGQNYRRGTNTIPISQIRKLGLLASQSYICNQAAGDTGICTYSSWCRGRRKMLNRPGRESRDNGDMAAAVWDHPRTKQ